MPRGVPNKTPDHISQLQTPEARAKAVATMRARGRRMAIGKVIQRIQNMDLTPIDEELADLRARIATLEQMRKVALSLRGEKEPASKPAHTLPDPKDLHRDNGATPAGDLVEKFFRHIQATAPVMTGEISDYFAVDRNVVNRVLRNDPRFAETPKGWVLKG